MDIHFRSALLNWYDHNKRSLPWRESADAYHVWLSEIILQQTRVDQGLPYYQAFIEHFPTVHDLANATEDEVLRLWQGLGYYCRGRNLRKTAIEISGRGGEFPLEYQELIKLKGIGPYTAAAIGSIAFNRPYAALDGNVIRVYSRVFGVKEDVRLGKTRAQLQALADECLDKDRPGDWNQALMDLGSMVCLPKKPLCTNCPFADRCLAKARNTTDQIPFKSKAPSKKVVYTHFVFIIHDSQIWLERRDNSSYWAGLYQGLEVGYKEESNQIIRSVSKEYELHNTRLLSEKTAIHLLSHRKIHLSFSLMEADSKGLMDKEGWKPLNSISSLAFPKPLAEVLKIWNDEGKLIL